jgi:hypothetical protein
MFCYYLPLTGVLLHLINLNALLGEDKNIQVYRKMNRHNRQQAHRKVHLSLIIARH